MPQGKECGFHEGDCGGVVGSEGLDSGECGDALRGDGEVLVDRECGLGNGGIWVA